MNFDNRKYVIIIFVALIGVVYILRLFQMSFSPPIPPKQVSPARGWVACFFVISEEGERQICVYPQWRYSTKLDFY